MASHKTLEELSLQGEAICLKLLTRGQQRVIDGIYNQAEKGSYQNALSLELLLENFVHTAIADPNNRLTNVEITLIQLYFTSTRNEISLLAYIAAQEERICKNPDFLANCMFGFTKSISRPQD